MHDGTPNQLYAIGDNPEYGIVAGAKDDQQHLIMFSPSHYLDLVFANDGDMLTAQRYGYSDRGNPSDQRQMIASSLDRTKPIHVKQFFLPEEYIGIRQYPTTIEEVIAEIDSYDDEEREYFQRDIDQWDRSKQFVLYWHKEYFLDQNGSVTSS